MSEWLIHCDDDLQSGIYYAGIDIHDGEQPLLVIFKKDGEKTIVVGQGEYVQQHGRLGYLDELERKFKSIRANASAIITHNSPTIIKTSESRLLS